MSSPIIPWQPSNVPIEIQNELNRRKINRSFKFVNPQQGGWNSSTGDWSKYRGPMVSWIRVCSNGAGHPLVGKERFVLYSGKGFYNTYGFGPPSSAGGSKQQIIGYTPGNIFSGEDAQPHVIENSLQTSNYPINIPAPEISRIEVTVQNELYRRAQIEWVCFSWQQLVYMTPYFLVPGITCMVEWGWNHYNVQSLVDLGDTGNMRKLWDNSYPLYDNVLNSNGNYDVLYGIVSNFNWSVEGNKIICTTEITSKDRLYSGIAKDYGLSVVNTDNPDKSGVFKSMRDFLNDKATIKNLKTLVLIPPKSNVDVDLSSILNFSPDNITWYNILNQLLTKGNAKQIGMRQPYVFGVFAGRPPDDKSQVGSYLQNEQFGKPKANDFDYKVQDVDPSKFWINMGMVVSILNYFSAVPSGANKGNNAFEVDIQNTVIAGHPNLISCDPRVLIPNSKAPKYLYGLVGLADNAGPSTSPDPKYPYTYQVLRPTPIGSSTQNKLLKSTLLQPNNACYRDDLDEVINYNRYRFTTANNDGLYSYSFPSDVDSSVLPVSIRGLAGNKLEKDFSGLLSNIYVSFQTIQDAVNDDSCASYLDIYNNILKVLMDASDGFWDLQIIDVDGVMTITDKKFVGKYGFNGVENPVFSFDYYDSDSIIKSLKFRPVLSDAQATRVMYGSVNNSGSRYQYKDKNDLLDYQFKDAIIINPNNGDPAGDLNRRKSETANTELSSLIRLVQNINSPSDDGTLQMSLNSKRKGVIAPSGTPDDMPEIIKLVLPNQQLLRLLVNDEDYDNNPRYCAVQPGIIMELTIQGIGGIRTFQYFLIKNLPAPYNDANVIFRATYVGQTLEAGTWETTIRAQLTPLRGYIKNRIVGPLGPSAKNNGWPS